MKTALLSCLLAHAFIFTFKNAVHAKSSVTGNVEVTTNYGKVKGIVLDFENGNGIHVFTGIRFAAPPVGELRWEAPQKPTPWTSTYDATYYRPSCFGTERANSSLEMSEDCLHINIHRPYKGAGLGSEPLPVMFWIYGGGYINGGSIKNPGHFIAQKGVVVVSFNYRLHALGFLNTGDEVAPGNYGMLDQNAALIFVKENIAAFGGNPDDITIFGVSAGASSCSLHLFSPKSKHLFKRAIFQSGSDMATWAVIDPRWKPSDYTRYLAEDLGCPNTNSTQMVNCLRFVSPEEITDAALDVLVDLKPGGMHIPWAPVVDGPHGFLPDMPANLRERGDFAKVPIMVGVTSNEGGDLIEVLESNMTRQEFLETIRDLVELVGWNNTDQQHDALNFEYTWWPDKDNITQNKRQLLDIISDVAFNVPVDQTAKLQSDVSDTYVFVFGYSSVNYPYPDRAVAHGREVPYVLGYPFLDETTMQLTGKKLSYNFTDEDRQFSDIIMTMWSNFAKYGNPTPNPEGGVTWLKFDRAHLQTLNLARNFEHLLNHRQHKYAFWTDFMPKLIDYKICPSKKGDSKRLHVKEAEGIYQKAIKLRAEAQRMAKSRKLAQYIDTLQEGILL